MLLYCPPRKWLKEVIAIINCLSMSLSGFFCKCSVFSRPILVSITSIYAHLKILFQIMHLLCSSSTLASNTRDPGLISKPDTQLQVTI